MSDPTRLLSVSQAAKRLGISDQTLRAYTKKGLVPFVKLPSGYRRFDPVLIEQIRHEWERQGATAQALSDHRL